MTNNFDLLYFRLVTFLNLYVQIDYPTYYSYIIHLSSSLYLSPLTSSFPPPIGQYMHKSRNTSKQSRDTTGMSEEEANQASKLADMKGSVYDEEESAVQDTSRDPFASTSKSSTSLPTFAENKPKNLTTRQRQAAKDVLAWEEGRMASAGLISSTAAEDVFKESEERRVNLLVHDTKPDFLEGHTVSTIIGHDSTQRSSGLVSVVRDPTSDLAVLARKGSMALRSYRETRDREHNKDKFWEASGNKIGNIIGLDKNAGKTEEERLRDEQEAIEDAKTKELLKLAQEQVDELAKGNNDTANKADKLDKSDTISKPLRPSAPMDADSASLQLRESQSYADSMKKSSAKVSEFSQSKSITEQRTFLPVYTVRSQLLQTIRDHQVIIVVGETGSGKTTQLTQYLMEDGFTRHGNIACTQPRRLAAVSVARRVAEEQGVELGTTVGYSIRFDDCTSPETVIKYMTDGMLLRESLHSPDLDKYSVIVMDEAHERSLNTDVLFGILKSVCARRSDLKLVITSATLDSSRFSRFFGNAPIFHIPGRTFPVEVVFRTSPSDDYVRDAVDQALTVHLSQPEGDILVFMTGQDDIEAVCGLLQQRIDELEVGVPPITILPIYSQLSADQHSKIFESIQGSRKCVVATNIAETSLTIDGVKYVIDSGYSKIKVFSPKVGMDALQVYPISQASAGQRAGRAGRTGPGICYRLYTEQQFNYEMLPNTVPEIQRTNLRTIVLLLKSLGIDDILEFEFMDPPPRDIIMDSLYALWVLGALNNRGKITDVGYKMADFPLDPPLSKLIISGDEMGCCAETLTIAAMLCEPELFLKPKGGGREEEYERIREKFHMQESDHLTLLNIYQQWRNSGFSSTWARVHFLNHKKLVRIREVRAQMMDVLKLHNMKLSSCDYDWDTIRKAICSAYFSNSARYKGGDQYSNLRTGLVCHLHPSSALYGAGTTPDYVIYHELVLTSKEFMRCVTVVEGEWLAELGPMFFSVRETQRQMMERKVAEAQKLQEEANEINVTVQQLLEMKKKKEEEDKERKREENLKRKKPKLALRFNDGDDDDDDDDDEGDQMLGGKYVSLEERRERKKLKMVDNVLKQTQSSIIIGETTKESRNEARKKRKMFGF